MSLTEFLLARIAEDEAVANEADWAMQGKWYVDADDKVDEYVRRLAPARALAECEAKRRIVANHLRHNPGESGYGASRYAVACLAMTYDHPDYQAEWKP
jgi:hypothetical protein